MREIEFKGIRIDNGEWVYGNLIMEDDECYISTGPLGIALDEGYWANSYGYPPSSSDFHITNIHEVIPKTVCQFTGLLDQKKVKIYEGDIVIIGATSSVIKYFPKYGMFGLTGKSAYKKFDESEPMGSGGSSTRYKPYVLSEYYQRRMEVIGNIHDKHQQKQALIDTMRGDEEIGLYDDNPKKSLI